MKAQSKVHNGVRKNMQNIKTNNKTKQIKTKRKNQKKEALLYEFSRGNQVDGSPRALHVNYLGRKNCKNLFQTFNPNKHGNKNTKST